MSKAKFAEPILDTIDQLRSRKARPDLARICHMVERRHGLGADDVQSSLAIMVDENLVIKVNYKGNISYRKPAKWKRRRRDLTEERRPAPVMRAKLPKKKLLNLKAAKALVKTKRKRGRPPLNKTKIKQVVKVDEDVEEAMGESVVEKAPEDVKDVTSKSAEAGSHKKVKGDSDSITDLSADETTNSRPSKTYTGRQKVRVRYELAKGRKSSGKTGLDVHGSVKVSGTESDHTVSETESPNDTASNDVEDTKSASTNSLVDSKKIKLIMSKKKLESRRLPGRPRKCLKLKKSISQDSQQSHPPTKKTCHEVGIKTDPKINLLVSETDDQDPRCDFCVRTAASNRNGQPEKLLICRDCQAKAHPSCMDYSDELAQRACRSPWQCIDCKTCNICNDSGDADAMLFCDACDKGYHMNCHQPPVEEKPKGKWVCCQCILEFGGSDDPIDSGENNLESSVDLPVEENISPADGGGASCLPTPNDSPVHFSEEVEESKMSSRLSPSIVVPLPRLATTLTAEVPDASSWSIVDVVKFFFDMGFIEQCEAFREQEIDGRALLLMTRMDVLTGLSLRLGPALKMYVHIQRLQRKHSNSH